MSGAKVYSSTPTICDAAASQPEAEVEMELG